MAVEVTRPSLQSFVQVLFDAFYYVPVATPYCALRTQDEHPCSTSDTHVPDRYPANTYFAFAVIS